MRRKRPQDNLDPIEAHLRILTVIRSIPRGRVSTYGRIAAAAGLPGRSRLVGRILRDSPLAKGVPWHRVVNATGRISDRSGPGPNEQRERLLHEGITPKNASSDRIDLTVYLWEP
ncbi:MAG: MGMT family protein [Phycisphaerae bacterium]